MVKPQRYFAWRIARQLFVSHFTFVLITLVITGFSLRYYAYTNFLGAAEIHTKLARFDSYLTSLFVTVLAGSAVYLAFSARHYARPLGRLIQRARQLRRLDAAGAENVSPEEIAEEINEEPGEWHDLERALNRLHSDLRVRTEAYSREREELSTLLGAVSDAILAVDKDENPLFFNTQFSLQFHVSRTGSQEWARSLSLGEIFRVPEVLQGYRSVLASGQMAVVAASLQGPQQTMPRHYSISVAPLRSAEGEPVYGAVGVFHDITELKQAEQIRIEFVGNASHELRTPLTSIKGYVSTLRGDIREGRLDTAGQFVDIIERNVDRMNALVGDLLDLSVIESGSELKKELISTRGVTEAALRQVEAKRAMRRQEIQSRFYTESVLGDPHRIEQVLVNLIHNAIKYIPEGRRIEVIWEDGEKGSLLRVKDNGPGIPVEHQARLFERFYRIDSGRSRDQGGTGLGLSIVKHIMFKHGGSVRLQSRPNEGAEFICDFPD